MILIQNLMKIRISPHNTTVPVSGTGMFTSRKILAHRRLWVHTVRCVQMYAVFTHNHTRMASSSEGHCSWVLISSVTASTLSR